MKTVLLGVTGCIAAYKACEIVRGIQKTAPDLNVKVVMTEHATKFVGPTTFRALTGNEVAVSLFDEASDPIHHISLAKEADVFCIAPATANVIAKIANGIADDLLTTTALATRAPLVIAPAMNDKMFENEKTQENIARCEAKGARIVSPASGYLACGDVGAGRLEDPQVIVAEILQALSRSRDLAGKRVLVTAGPTQEAIDPVRYLSNRSSGIQGYAIAAEAAARGAQVTLVSGPVALQQPEGVTCIQVRSAREMLAACEAPFKTADLAVFVAAVSDWRPAEVSQGKIKHDGGNLELTLVPNPDIAATLAEDGELIETNPERLQKVDDRLNTLYSLCQKHRAADEGELIALRDRYAAQLDAITHSDEELAALQTEIGAARNEAELLASELHRTREQAAPAFAGQIVATLVRLGMPDARFEAAVVDCGALTEGGRDRVEFRFSANRTTPPAAVERIASGGELSRVMLALKALLARRMQLPTILFDEIDTGVSGRIADAMGEIICALAETMQVVDITHLPQVASKGSTHFVVYKRDGETHIARLTPDERTTEIAKMLSGSEVTEAAMTQARILLGGK